MDQATHNKIVSFIWGIADAESRLWAAADKLWANTGLKPSEFSTPVLGLIFLRYAETRFMVMNYAKRHGLRPETPAAMKTRKMTP